MFNRMPTSTQESTENDRISILINVTRALCKEPEPTLEVFNEVFDAIHLLLDEWVLGCRKVPPYVEEIAWVKPFIKFLQRAELHEANFFWGVLQRHLYPRIFLSLDALNAWSGKLERLKCFADGVRYKTPRHAVCNLLEKFEKLAYDPEQRRAPEDSLLRREYDKLEKELLGDDVPCAISYDCVAKSKEEVCVAVAKCILHNKQKGMKRPAAIEKAIADNIADITALGLWRLNKGRPDEGEPGSSWKACYQTLYDKGYLKQ